MSLVRVVTRITPETRAAMELQAAKEGCSSANLISRAIQAYLAKAKA